MEQSIQENRYVYRDTMKMRLSIEMKKQDGDHLVTCEGYMNKCHVRRLWLTISKYQQIEKDILEEKGVLYLLK